MRNIFLSIIAILFLNSCKNLVTSTTTNITSESEVDKVKEQDIPEWVPKPAPYRAARKRENDLIHMKLEISFDWKKQHAFGSAELLLTPYFYPQSKVQLDAKGFDIHSIKLKRINGEEIEVEYVYDSLTIDVKLDKEYKRGEKFFLKVVYTAKPNELEVGGSSAITQDKGLYFINPLREDKNKPQQIWTQGETQANSCWFPTIDTPNEKITQELYITVDTNYTTLSNGSLVYSVENDNGTRTDYWRQTKPHAPYLVMMAIGEYSKVKDNYQGLDVDYYVEKEFEPYAKSIFGNTPEMIDFFSNLLDYPYPWDKYSQIVVRDYVSGAMENTSASIFMEALQINDREILDQNWDGIIAHELFHHWFGDLVTCESWSNLPLNESFANYSEFLWDEHKYGIDKAEINALGELYQYLTESNTKREPLIRFHYADKEDMFDSHSYAKGGRILHMLRNYVGDEAFFQSLSYYLKKNEFGSVEIHDLRLAFEQITGEDLNWFFNQWFFNLGHPELNVSHFYSLENKKLVVNIKQVQDTNYMPVYILPLYIDYWINGEKRREGVIINKREQKIIIEMESSPQAIVFDGEQQMLGTINHKRTKNEIVEQYKKSKRALVRLKALSYFNTKEENDTILNNQLIRNMYLEALEDENEDVRELAIIKLENYEGADKEKYFEKLKKVALTEKSVMVRAQALYVLSKNTPSEFKKIFENNLGHKSYTVSAEALNGYLKAKEAIDETLITEFINSDNEAYIAVIAEYYSEDYLKDHKEWYLSKINKSEEATYELIIFYAEYLDKRGKEKEVESGIEVLKQIALNNSYSFWQKISAFQGILIFEGNDLANNAIDEIKQTEKDEKLLQYYKYF